MLTHLCPAEGIPAESGFALSDDGSTWRYHGTLTFDNVGHVYASSRLLALPAGGVVDLSGLVHADSSALAVLLGLSRRAKAERKRLSLAALPHALLALAQVYGIDELLAPTVASADGAGS